MNKRKNIISIIALVLVILTLASCTPVSTGDESTPAVSESESTPAATEPESTPEPTEPESTPESTPEETPVETPTEPESTPEETTVDTPIEDPVIIPEEPTPGLTIVNLYDMYMAFDGIVTVDGLNYINEENCTSHYIEVTAGEKLYFGPCDPNQEYQLHGYDSSKRMAVAGVRSEVVEESTFPTGYVIYSYIVPENVSYIRFIGPSKYNSCYTVCREAMNTADFRLYWGHGGVLDVFEKLNSSGYIDYEREVFKGKKALFLGDELCEATIEIGEVYRGWAGRISLSTGMVCLNRGGKLTYRFRDIITVYNMANTQEYDYIIMQGGVGNKHTNIPAGNVSDGFDPSGFVTSTYAGGLEELFYNVTRDHPNAKLGYIFNYSLDLPFDDGFDEKLEAYYSVAKKVCEKWGVPYLNMFEDEMLTQMLNKEGFETYYDQLSLTSSGYDITYKYVMYWMETLPTYNEIKMNPEAYKLESFPVKKSLTE